MGKVMATRRRISRGSYIRQTAGRSDGPQSKRRKRKMDKVKTEKTWFGVLPRTIVNELIPFFLPHFGTFRIQ
jgi:hypothetical protein